MIGRYKKMNDAFKWYCEKCGYRVNAVRMGESQPSVLYCKLTRRQPIKILCPIWHKSKTHIEIAYEKEKK
jgi:C4-type Zn-finger protein